MEKPAQPRLPARVTASNPPVQQAKTIMFQKDQLAQPPRPLPTRMPGGVPDVPSHVAAKPPEQKSTDRCLRLVVPIERHGALEATHQPACNKQDKRKSPAVRALQ
ncbi:hypothetical protein MRX96_034439 [Rhipicephalus microplus]